MIDIDIIEKSVFLLLHSVDVKVFLRYAYVYLKQHPEQIPKVYQMISALKQLIEREFGDKIGATT